MNQILELPDFIYNALVEAANAAGETPVAWIAARLPKAGSANGPSQSSLPTDEDIAKANASLRAHMVDLGHSVGCDNEQIDADLVREYGDDHTNLDRTDDE